METTMNPHIAAQVVRYALTRARKRKTGTSQGDAGRHIGTAIRVFGQAAAELINGRRTTHPDLAEFRNWRSVVRLVEDDSADPALTALVRWIEKDGVAALIDQQGVAQPTIAGYESGRALPPLLHMKILLDFYGRPQDFAKLVPVYRAASQERPRGETVQVTGVIDGALRMGLNYFATEIRAYTPNVLVGELQTEDYARHVIDPFAGLWPPIPASVDQVALRMEQQEILRMENPPQYTAFVDESSLLEPIGGAAVMRKQLQLLLDLTDELEHVDIRVIPRSVGHHPLKTTPVALLTFDDDAPLGFGVDWNASHYYNDADAIGTATRLLGYLGDVGLDRPESRRRIAQLLTEFEV